MSSIKSVIFKKQHDNKKLDNHFEINLLQLRMAKQIFK